MEKRKSDIPKVAVITRTKDRPLLLDRSIKSVLTQTYSDFVIVIVNDGGNPKSIEKILNNNKVALKERYILINNKESVGHGAACNVGVNNSESKYIVMLDDDDTWHKDFLKEMVGYLETTDEFGVVSASNVVHERIEDDRITLLRQEPFLPNVKEINLFSMLGGNQFPNMAFLYRRKALEKVGVYDNSSSPLEDWDFNIRFLKNYNIHFLDKVLVYYHQREDQKGSQGNSIFVTANLHTQQNTKLLNKYLRQDLDRGVLGAGFIANLSQQMLVARSEDLTFLNNIIRQSTSETHSGINGLHDKASEIIKTVNHLDKKSNALIEVRLKRKARKIFNNNKNLNK